MPFQVALPIDPSDDDVEVDAEPMQYPIIRAATRKNQEVLSLPTIVILLLPNMEFIFTTTLLLPRPDPEDCADDCIGTTEVCCAFFCDACELRIDQQRLVTKLC